MAPPRNHPELFPEDATMRITQHGEFIPSGQLIHILVRGRERYAWRDDPLNSQRRVSHLEEEVANSLTALTPEAAQQIVSKVSLWGGNNKKSQRAIDNASMEYRERMQWCIENLVKSSSPNKPLHELCNLPGISLVMASKTYRFCCPDEGASLDRHSSYFFNSVPTYPYSAPSGFVTDFLREWSNGRQTSSRLAIYQPPRLRRNLEQYVQVYLPRLTHIAQFLNEHRSHYTCAVTQCRKAWRPADVEMAAYHWWSENGAK